MRQLRIGVIGAGFTGQQHIEAIRRIPGTEVKALSESNSDVAAKKSEQLGINKYYLDYRDMLRDPEIDIIHNCTPNNMHFTINKDIILSGKHVYSEKPLAVSTDESCKLLELAIEHGVAHGVNFNYRQNSMVQEMRERIVSSDNCRIFMVRGHYLQDWLLYETDYDWRMDPKIGGPSRAVADIGSHWFDAAQFVTGKKIASVFAHLITMHPERIRCRKTNETFSANRSQSCDPDSERIPITSEDAAFIIIKFDDGTPGGLAISQVSAGRKNDIRLAVDCNDYSLEWEQEDPDKLWVGRRDKPNELLYSSSEMLTGNAKRYATLPSGHSVSWHDALRNGINEFYKAIRNDSFRAENQHYATFREGHQIMQIMEACLESSKKNMWVDVK